MVAFGALDAIGELLVPDAVLRAVAAGVGFLAVAVAEAEIDPLTNKLQLSTPAALEWISASALDKNAAGGHVRQFNYVGVGADNRPTNFTAQLNATDGTTFVLGTDSLLDAWHLFADLWGSGGLDAAGQIDLRKIDDTIVGSIAINANEGSGSGFKVPTGWAAYLAKGSLEASGAQAAGQGTTFTIKYIDAVDALTSVQVLFQETHNIVGVDSVPVRFQGEHVAGPGEEIQFYQNYLQQREP